MPFYSLIGYAASAFFNVLTCEVSGDGARRVIREVTEGYQGGSVYNYDSG